MVKKTKAKTKSRLCKMCGNDCKDLYPYGAKYVKPGCYFFRRREEDGNG